MLVSVFRDLTESFVAAETADERDDEDVAEAPLASRASAAPAPVSLGPAAGVAGRPVGVAGRPVGVADRVLAPGPPARAERTEAGTLATPPLPVVAAGPA